MFMAKLLFDATELESFCVQPNKVTRNCVQKPCLFECFFQQHILANLDFSLYFFWKTTIGTIWTPQTIRTWLWLIVCQGM